LATLIEPAVHILIWILLATLFRWLLSAALASLFLCTARRGSRAAAASDQLATGAMLARRPAGAPAEAIVDVGPGRVQAIGARCWRANRLFLSSWKSCALAALPQRGLRAASCALGAASRPAAAWICW